MFNTTKTISTETRRAVYARDDYSCVLCEDSRTIHLHHYIPRGRGGNDTVFNLVCVCPTCHKVLHGEYLYSFDFPFDKETAEDALHHYLADWYRGFTSDLCLRE